MNIIMIEELKDKTFAEYIVTYFANGLMGEGMKADAAVRDILSRTGTVKKIPKLTSCVDADFIRDMVAIMSSSDDFCEVMNSLQVVKNDRERVFISKLRAYSEQKQNNKRA